MRAGMLFILFSFQVVANAATMVRVRPHIVVKPDSDVKLSDVVDAGALSEESRKKIASTLLTRSPARGERQELAAASLMQVLRPLVQAERRRQGQVHLILPKTVLIDTVKRELSAERVSEELIQVWQPLCSECRLEVDSLSLPAVVQVRDWHLKMKAELPRGSFSVPVELVRENGQIFSAWINGRLIIKRKVPVARRLLMPNERLQPSDIEWQHRDTAFALDGVPSEEELLGKKIKQSIRANDVIWMSSVERDRAISRGEMVQVKSGDGNWQVTLGLIAQQDAHIGDTITFKNPKTNSVISGQVVGRGEVELR